MHTNQNQHFIPRQKIVPLKYAFKVSPPIISLFYKRRERDEKIRKYEIFLNDLILLPTAEEITRVLFQEHTLYLDQSLLKFKQVQSIVEKLLEALKKKSEARHVPKERYHVKPHVREAEPQSNKKNNLYQNYKHGDIFADVANQEEKYQDNDDQSNELDKSFKIEQDDDEQEEFTNGKVEILKNAKDDYEVNYENTLGKGKMNFLRNLRKKNTEIPTQNYMVEYDESDEIY